MKSQDLRERELREAVAQGTKPLHGLETEEFIKRSDRQKLPPKDRLECQRLDAVLPEQKTSATRATGQDKARTDVQLYQSRKRYNDLNC